jgi:hypothetical protein
LMLSETSFTNGSESPSEIYPTLYVFVVAAALEPALAAVDADGELVLLQALTTSTATAASPANLASPDLRRSRTLRPSPSTGQGSRRREAHPLPMSAVLADE